MDELLSHRERINTNLQQIIDEHTEPWGIKVSIVEVKDVELPPTMQRPSVGSRRWARMASKGYSGRKVRMVLTQRVPCYRNRSVPQPHRIK